MADFRLAIPGLLKHEGAAFVNNTETGEVSRYGVTLKSYRLLEDDTATADTIYGITDWTASVFYEKHFWDPLLLGQVNDQALAEKAFDLAVNQGPPTAAKELQQAVKDVEGADTIKADGVIGPKTIAAVNAGDPVKLLAALRARAAARYQELAANNPYFTKVQAGGYSILDAWLARLAS